MRLKTPRPAAETEHGTSELVPRAAEMNPGEMLGGYRIESVAGRGGMGVVYRATHLHLERTVALKVLGLELVDSPGFRERFLREARTAASISHPGMVTVYDAGEAAGQLYIAMQFVDGTDLSALLHAEGALEPGRVVGLLRQIAGALDVAHGMGVVHRDVKPANVMIDGELCYLTDFGLTKRITSETVLTKSGHYVGTVHYMAPEQVEAGAVDGRSDVYALACVAFHALAGSPPYERDSEVSIAMAHMNAPPPSLMARNPDVPTGLDAVLTRGMSKKRDDRQPTCGELVADLAAALRGAATQAGPAAERATTVLVAAKEPGTRAVVRASLKRQALELLEASEPTAALLMARRERPALAVADAEMAARLRDDGLELPIVGIGAGESLRTPFSALQLIHAVRRAADSAS
ncbi:MAG: protein kinase [Thermoleophilaceae bacterium]|nr:protein kinase [Thermoleophilaceae bacterium]